MGNVIQWVQQFFLIHLPVTKKNQHTFRTGIQLSSVYKTLKLESQFKYCYMWKKGRVGNLKKYRCKKQKKQHRCGKIKKLKVIKSFSAGAWSWMNEEKGEIINSDHSPGLQMTPTSSLCRQLWTPHPPKLHWSNTSCSTEQSTSSIQMGPWE